MVVVVIVLLCLLLYILLAKKFSVCSMRLVVATHFRGKCKKFNPNITLIGGTRLGQVMSHFVCDN